jgi:flagellar assembly factor FliW
MIDQTVTASAETTTSGAGPGEILFVRPIPGFSGLRRWALTRFDGEESALWELVSVERPEIRFLVATAYGFFPHYDVALDDDVCAELGLEDASDALVLVVLTVSPSPSSITANLLAPVVINARTSRAAQVILSGSDWPVRAPLG